MTSMTVPNSYGHNPLCYFWYYVGKFSDIILIIKVGIMSNRISGHNPHVSYGRFVFGIMTFILQLKLPISQRMLLIY